MEHLIFASYGNDSIALIQWAHERGLPSVHVAYSNTGWAADWWLARVPKPAERVALSDHDIDTITLAQWGPQLGAMAMAHRAYARAVIAEYERINGITPAQGKETQG